MSDNNIPQLKDHVPSAPPGQASEMLAARKAALGLLESVLTHKQALDHALERDGAFKGLPGRDRAFCRMLTATTLRRLGQIDDLIAKAEKKPSRKNSILQNILRMGVCQILFMEVADHAAVDTSVRLAQSHGLERQKGFVNGLLRTITRVGQEWLERQDEARLNTPEWLLKIWIEEYELRTAAEIATANLAEAPLDITIKDESERNHWSSELKATQMSTGTLRLMKSGAVYDLPGFGDGMWWVQDAAASIPAKLFGAQIKGQTVVDLCAAPGGKTMQLAAAGAHVIALDRSAKRLQKLEQNLERLRLSENVEVIAADAGAWQPKEPPRFILLDAPCSATGTIRRHPDVLHLKSAGDIDRLIHVQAAILENAYSMLAPGGVLIYCTCSLQKSEGEAQIQALFERHEDAYKRPITVEDLSHSKDVDVSGLEEMITEQGDLRILPYHNAALGGMDGFFVSRITKAE